LSVSLCVFRARFGGANDLHQPHYTRTHSWGALLIILTVLVLRPSWLRGGSGAGAGVVLAQLALALVVQRPGVGASLV
jgi:hypothetical protein